MIPFERDPGARREPRRGAASVDGRGAVDPALRERDPGARDTRAAWLHSLAGWLIAPLILCSVVAAFLLVTRGADRLFAAAFAGVLALGMLWILVSALFPARADRRCPRCGDEHLVRLSADSTRGLRCRACAWRDPSASSFLLAEDDGVPLEDLALRERGHKRWR